MSGILGNALAGGVPGAVSAVAQFAGKILDRAIPDAAARATAELELARRPATNRSRTILVHPIQKRPSVRGSCFVSGLGRAIRLLRLKR